MMKTIEQLDSSMLDYLRTHPVDVYEKLDMMYFKVKICSDIDVMVYTSKGRPVNEIDMAINSVYVDINDFVRSFIVPKRDEIIEAFGDTEIGFFYMPSVKPNNVDYRGMGYDKAFIMSDVFVEYKDKKDNPRLFTILGHESNVRPMPLIYHLDRLPDFDITPDDPVGMIEKITGGLTWSYNKVEDIEGIVLRHPDGKCICKIDTGVSAGTHKNLSSKICRDMVIESFVATMMDDDRYLSIINPEAGYIDNIANLFLEYINITNLMDKAYFDAEDLLPLSVGYIGDLDYTRFPSTVAVICKHNEIYKNILRILLVTFSAIKWSNDKGLSNQMKINMLKIFNTLHKK